AREPTVLVHRAISQNLEILLRVPGRRLGIIERESETHALHRYLRNTVDLFWLRQTGRFENGWSNISAMSELTAQTALVRNAFWPTNHHRVTNPAEMRCYLFAPLKRRVPRPCPCCRVMRRHVGASPFV